ncbi:MAG: hypothetical protein CMJ81_02665 [Planctomycetaceae bacterium]|nr:hypothetical protein [Planctomycetaceae bacterium]
MTVTLQTTTRNLCSATILFVLLFAAIPVGATPLTGSGLHLPIPTINPAWQPGVSATVVDTGGAFTGTWTAPVQADWVGTFNATGTVPSSTTSGIANYNFTSLPLGYLPSGTFFIFGDLDHGSSLAETAQLTAYDGSGNLLTTPWLDETYALRGPGTGLAGAITSGDMPGWSWNDVTSPATYVFDGSTITSGNPNVAFALVSNQPIHGMELDKLTTHFGFTLAAPSVPEPSSVVIACLGLLTVIPLRRR